MAFSSYLLIILLSWMNQHTASTEQSCGSQNDKYDMIVNPNWDFLSSIGPIGWDIQFNNQDKSQEQSCDENDNQNGGWFPSFRGEQKPDESLDSTIIKSNNENQSKNKILKISDIEQLDPNRAYRYVGVIGFEFNVGKTTILNMILNSNFSSGLDYAGETRGICFVFPKSEDDSYIFIDTPGKKRPVKENELQDRSMTDVFVEELIPEIADIMLYVVSSLDSDTQINIKKVIKRIARLSTPTSPKKLFVVHNFQRLTKIEEIDYHIQTDIVIPFDATKEVDRLTNSITYTHIDTDTELQVKHFILAKKNSNAANKWNPQTLKTIQTQLSAGGFIKRNFMDHLISHLSNLMREYFKSPQKQNMKNDADNAKSENEDDVSIYDFYRRGLAWMGKFGQRWFGSNDAPDAVKNVINTIEDPWKLILARIPKKNDIETKYKNKNNKNNNKIQNQIKIILANPRILEYEYVSKLGEQPQTGPKIGCHVMEFKNSLNSKSKLWILTCDIPGGILSSNQENPNLQTEFTITLDEYDDTTMVNVYGTILSDVNFKDESISKFGLPIQEYSDRRGSGWFWRSYHVPLWVARRWETKIQTFDNGRLKIMVEK